MKVFFNGVNFPEGAYLWLVYLHYDQMPDTDPMDANSYKQHRGPKTASQPIDATLEIEVDADTVLLEAWVFGQGVNEKLIVPSFKVEDGNTYQVDFGKLASPKVTKMVCPQCKGTGEISV